MILVVDDYEDACSLIVRMLGRQGLSAVYTTSAKQALERMRSNRPEALVLDDSMPGMTGLELLELMREDAELSRIPVVMYSAVADPERVAKAKELGARAWIPKDGSFRPLKDAVQAAIA